MHSITISDELKVNDDNNFDFFLVFDMRDLLIDDISKERFESIIGTKVYSDFLKKLLNTSKNPFTSKGDEEATVYIKRRVFKKRLIDDYLFSNLYIKNKDINLFPDLKNKTDKLAKDTCLFPDLEETIVKLAEEINTKYPLIFQSIEEVKHKFFSYFQVKLTLSLNGSISIRIRLKTEQATLNEINIFNHFLHSTELNVKNSFADHDIFAIIIREFLKNYGDDLNQEDPDLGKPALNFNLNYFNKESGIGLIHQHYYVLSTKNFESHNKVTINQIKKKITYDEYKKQIMCFLRGTFIDGKCSDVKLHEYPTPNKKIDFIADYDLSSQEDGLCLFTSRRALIINENMHFGYWDGIIRGIELMLTLKVEILAMEYHISSITEKIQKIETKSDLKSLEKDLSNILTTVQRFRILLVPKAYSTTTCIIKKLEALICFYGLKELNQYIESNIAELYSFLSDSNKILLMTGVDENEYAIKKLNKTLVILGALSIAVFVIVELYKIFVE